MFCINILIQAGIKMASNLLFHFLLLVAAESIWAMDDPIAQEETPFIDGAASYKVFYGENHAIEHRWRKVDFLHINEDRKSNNNVYYYDKEGNILKSENLSLADIRGLEHNDSESRQDKCHAINCYRSSGVCEAIEEKLDPRTKRTAINFVPLTDNYGSKYITFYADNDDDEFDDNIALLKLNFSDLTPDKIDEHINSWKYFINISQELENSLKEYLNRDESEDDDDKDNDCVIS